MLLYGIDAESAASEDHPVYGGTLTALYEQLQEALLHPDRVASVGLHTTIQSMDAAVETAAGVDGKITIQKKFTTAAVRPKRFVPDPDAW